MGGRISPESEDGLSRNTHCDETHQYKNESGQGYAFGALASACKYILCLTGTLAGGYSSDVYHLLFRTRPQLMLEDNNAWGNPKKFIEHYGVLERITRVREEDVEAGRSFRIQYLFFR